MEDAVLDQLMLNSKKQIEWARRFEKKRYLFRELGEIDKEYYVGIKGVRGIGKTVLTLQLASTVENSVYFSADSVLVKSVSLYEIVKSLVKRGFTSVFIDEIHRKPEWDKDIKTLYDEHEVRIFFSGSSSMDITKTAADLSRRVVLKDLKPISFREFLNIRKNMNISTIPFDDILDNKVQLVQKYAELRGFIEEYNIYGGVLYPQNGFSDAMENAIRKVVLDDLSSLRDINIKYEEDAYKLLYLVAKSPPFEVNYSKIANDLEISKTMSVRLVSDLESAGLVIPVFPCKKKGINVKKEPKLYLTIPLRGFFGNRGVEINKGSSREEFFVNHVRNLCYLKGNRGEKTPDFRFKDKIFEIGGESKKGYQNPDYIVSDSLSTESSKIPLLLFGLIY